ncbi:hypothetical protein FRC17_007045 [Serendipita sp. 399]|nr:hypothetical protein FRC17_007045 [Serendipita sp. 399]
MAILVRRRQETGERHAAWRRELDAYWEGGLSDLRGRLEQLGQRSRFHYSLMAPVARLPVEILARIFEAYVEMEETAWKLVFVNSRWRKIVLSTPNLWKYILITNDEHLGHCQTWNVGGDIGEVRSREHYTVCMNNAQLQPRVYSPWEDPDHTPLMLLLREPTSARIAKVAIELHGDGEDFTPPLVGCIEGPYPRLRRLTYAEWGYNWDTTFIGDLLSSCKLTDIEFQDSIPTGVATVSIWDSVLSLKIGHGPDADEFNAICHKLHNLRTLEGCTDNWPDEATLPTTFQFLKELELSCIPSNLSHLTLPVLTKLTLSIPRWWDESSADVTPSWRLPALSELRIDLCNMEQVYLIPSASVPILDTLTNTASGECLSLSPITYPTVRSVQLDGHKSSQLLEDLFSTAPNARKVTIAPARSDLPLVVEALKSLAVAKKSKRILFPDATEFYLGAEGYPVHDDRSNVSRLAKLVITNRLAANIAPTVFEVFYASSGSLLTTERVSYVDNNDDDDDDEDDDD